MSRLMGVEFKEARDSFQHDGAVCSKPTVDVGSSQTSRVAKADAAMGLLILGDPFSGTSNRSRGHDRFLFIILAPLF
jgi:hypothetical protein